MTTLDQDLEDEEQTEETDSIEAKRIPPVAVKVSKFGPAGGSKFGK